MQDEDRKIFLMKEVETIQSVINRISSNSFLIKGWAVTLVVGTLLLKWSDNHSFIAFIPIILFWILDSYFLWQERLYRKLYNWVIDNRLKTDQNLFKMDTTEFKTKVSKLKAVFSMTLLCFYGSIFGITVIYTILIYFTWE